MRVFLSSTPHPADFSEVLETASQAAGVDLDPDAFAAREALRSIRTPVSHLQQLAERERESRVSMLSASIESYLEQLGDNRARSAARTADLDAIADELGITPAMTLDDLGRLRRKFALANHPDRTSCDERDVATRRMMIANMLIDRELKRR